MGLDRLRKQIDRLDDQLVLLLARRMKLVRGIAVFKKHCVVSLLQPEREKKILAHKKRLAKRYSLDPTFVEQLFNRIFRESKKLQKGIFKLLKR